MLRLVVNALDKLERVRDGSTVFSFSSQLICVILVELVLVEQEPIVRLVVLGPLSIGLANEARGRLMESACQLIVQGSGIIRILVFHCIS